MVNMRKTIIVGNWKMYPTIQEAIGLVRILKEKVGESTEVEIGVCPPFVYLLPVGEIIKDSSIKLGAQNCHWEPRGAFTGEISAEMLKEIGCSYVIVGHSERRHLMGETNEIINKKIKAALRAGLNPIFCIGELLEDRQEGKTESVLRRQLEEGLDGIASEEFQKIIIAYEPVWAIGTGKTATPQQAEQTHFFIREFLARLINENAARNIRIMYGGSVKPENIKEIICQPNVDGALVGGASLEVDSFLQIITQAKIN